MYTPKCDENTGFSTPSSRTFAKSCPDKVKSVEASEFWTKVAVKLQGQEEAATTRLVMVRKDIGDAILAGGAHAPRAQAAYRATKESFQEATAAVDSESSDGNGMPVVETHDVLVHSYYSKPKHLTMQFKLSGLMGIEFGEQSRWIGFPEVAKKAAEGFYGALIGVPYGSQYFVVLGETTANAVKLIKSIQDLNEARGEEQFLVALDIDGKYSQEDVESKKAMVA